MGDVSAGKILAAGEASARVDMGQECNSPALAALHYSQMGDATILDRVAERMLVEDFRDNTPLNSRDDVEPYWRKRTREVYQIAAWIVDERRRLIDAAKAKEE